MKELKEKTVGSLLTDGQLILFQASIDNPMSEARILLAFVMSCTIEHLLISRSEVVSFKHAKKFWALIGRRSNHEPIAYIIGKKEFYGIEFNVNRHVLIPRPETETLIDLALESWDANRELSILDLGTGSGCLLLTLLKLFPKSWGLGIDIKKGALAVATQNAQKMELSDRTRFSNQDWKNLTISMRFDLIVSNPPYITTQDVSYLPQDIKDYEPILALDGGHDGLFCYKILMPIIQRSLTAGGMGIVECGYGQYDAISTMASKSGLAIVKYVRDYSGIIRAIATSRK